MIIKSSQRAGHKQLANHLMKRRDIDGTPQTVTVSGSRDLVIGDDVHEALDDMALMAKVSRRCQKDLYHISMSPDQAMTERDWETAWALYETEFGLENLAYIEVTHAKGEHRPPHRHRVYERVDTETGKAVQLSHNFVRNEKTCRLIEYTLNHNIVFGRHTAAVLKRLEEDGRDDVIGWMREHEAHKQGRAYALKNHADAQMEKRTKIPIEQARADLQACYERSPDGQSFQLAIAEKGYVLAKGDRRDYAIVDWMGGIHPPPRRIGVKTRELRQRWADLDKNSLISIADVMEQLKMQWAASSEDSQSSTDSNNASATSTVLESQNGKMHGNKDSLSELRQQSEDLAAEIQDIEAAIVAEGQQQIGDEALNYWQRQRVIEGAAESERSKPRSKLRKKQGRGGESKLIKESTNIKDEAQLLTLQGQNAIAERQRRLLALTKPVTGNKTTSHHPIADLSEQQALAQGLIDYQRFWQQRFKGQTAKQLAANQAYRLGADRWLLQRLAQRGYNRHQARRILIQSSPELLNQRYAERQSYVRRMVNRVYVPYEQQLAVEQQKQRSQDKTAPVTAIPKEQGKPGQDQGRGEVQQPPTQKPVPKQSDRDRKDPDIER